MMPPPSYSRAVATGQLPDRAQAYIPEASGYSSPDDRRPLTKPSSGKMPGFVKKWFDLDQPKKEDIREIRHNWIAAQKDAGISNVEQDLEGLKTIMPKFAAKWFVLPHEEKERYRAMRRKKKYGADIPGFAAQWFALSDRKKNEYRKIKKSVNVSRKSHRSDSEEGFEDFEEAGLPEFAAKWFSLAKATKDEIRVKYRHSQKCQKDDCECLAAMMSMLHMGKHSEAATCPPPPFHPMMQPYGAPSPWTRPYYQPMYAPPPAQEPCMSQPPYCLMKRFFKTTSSESSSESETETESPRPKTSKRASGIEDIPDMPKFVKKWFALPMEARQQIRMLKQYQKKHGKCGAAIPPFAKKWFALSEKKKQKWRHLQRAQRQNRQERSQSAPVSKIRETSARFDTVPDFAAKWFSLPVEQKYHLRMLNQYLSGDHSDESDTSDEFAEAMPEFAAKWFALTSDQRQQLRDMKHDKKFKKDKKKYKAESQSEAPHSGSNPWQQWAYYSSPPMDYFRGQQQGGYSQMKPSKDTHDDSDY